MLSNGRLDLGGYDYYLGTTWRNQMLELRFDTNQGCFLGQPAGSETTLTIALKAPDGNRLDGRTRPPAGSTSVSIGPAVSSRGVAPV